MHNEKMIKIIKEITNDNSYKGEIDLHKHNNVSYIHNFNIDLQHLGSAQKGYVRLAWNNIDGCIDENEDMDITAILHVYDNNRELRSYIQIEDLFHDIQNIKEQIIDINPLHIYDMQGNEIWNCYDCFDL